MPKIPQPDTIFRSPAALARDEFMQSEEGLRLCDIVSLRAPSDQRQYLENRIKIAFEAGMNVGEKLALKEKMVISDQPIPTTKHDLVIQEVLFRYGLTRDQLIGHVRRREYSTPRHVAIYLCRKFTDLGTEAIAVLFGKDHTLVTYAAKSIKDRMDTDSQLFTEVSNLETSIKDKLYHVNA